MLAQALVSIASSVMGSTWFSYLIRNNLIIVSAFILLALSGVFPSADVFIKSLLITMLINCVIGGIVIAEE